MIFTLLSSALFLLPIYAAVRVVYLRRLPRRGSWAREAALCGFTLFTVGLLALVWQTGPWHQSAALPLQLALERLQSGAGVNFVPLRTLRLLLASAGAEALAVNLLGNVLMFVPLGLCPPLLWRRWQRFGWAALLGLLAPLLIEFVQLFLGRSVDVDDLLLNFCGILLGYGLYRLLTRLFPGLNKLAAPRKNGKNRGENEAAPH